MTIFKTHPSSHKSRRSRSTKRRIGRIESLESRDLLTFLAQITSTEYVATPNSGGSAVDDMGNTYIGGTFQGTVDFDPGPDTELISSQLPSAYVAKYNSQGEFEWVRPFQVEGRKNGLYSASVGVVEIDIDENGAIYVAGSFTFSVDFVGDGSFMASSGKEDFYVAKLDAMTGTTTWVKTVGGSDTDQAYAIAASGGNVYVTGYFHETVDFDPGDQVSEMTGEGDVFVLTLDELGQYVSSWSFGGAYRDLGRDIIVDDQAIYLAGTFYEAADFDPSPSTNVRTGVLTDWYLASYSKTGALNWVQSIGNEDLSSLALRLSSDDSRLYFASSFDVDVDVDPSESEFNLTTNGSSAAFIAAYSKVDGSLDTQFTPAIVDGDTSGDSATLGGVITVDDAGAVYFSVRYSGAIDIDPREPVVAPPLGNSDSVALKLDASGNYLSHLHTEAYSAHIVRAIGETLYMAGGFVGTASFPSGDSLTATGSGNDVYLLSLTLSEPPIADAGVDVVGTEDMSVTFDASGSSDPEGDALSYFWDFGDGLSATTTSPTVDHLYSYGGEFDVMLTVSDGNGNSTADTVVATVAEVNDLPVADPGGPYIGLVSSLVTFDASASVDFDNVDGTTVNDQTLTYTWDFGDGKDSVNTNSPIIQYAYDVVGEYTVTLSVSDIPGNSVSISTTATIEDAPVGDPKDIYVWDIADAFETRQRGRNNTDHRVVLTVHNDSDGDGIAEATDAVLASVEVTVELRNSNGILVKTLTGMTDSNGVFQSDWIKGLQPGDYRADVVDLAFGTFEWNALLDVEDDQMLTV